MPRGSFSNLSYKSDGSLWQNCFLIIKIFSLKDSSFASKTAQMEVEVVYKRAHLSKSCE